MGAAGSSYAAFRRALRARDLTLALAEALDLPRLSFADALALLLLIRDDARAPRDRHFERALRTWLDGAFPPGRRVCLTRRVRVYGIASRVSNDVDEWHTTREEAEATLAEVVDDEPELAEALYVAEVDFDLNPN